MHLLKRNDPNNVIRELSPRQSWLLKNDGISAHNRTISQNILSSFYLKYWLRCDCLTNGPIMAIRHNAGGAFSLVTIHIHGPHAKECPLHTIQNTTNRTSADMTEPESSFNFHKPIRPNSSKRARLVTDSISVRQNSLYRLLATLFVEAGLTNLSEDPGFIECEKNLIEAAKELRLAGHILSDHLFFGIEKFKQVRSHVQNQQNSKWIKSRPHAILIDVVDHVTKTAQGFQISKHFSKSRNIDFNLYSNLTSIYLHSGRMSLKKGPFVIISTIAETTRESGTKLIAPLRSYIAPVISKANWVIIDSDYERRVALKLIKSKIWYEIHKKLSSTVSKPLFYIDTPEGPCLPDFQVCSDEKSIVFEVMGSHAEKYLERKSGTHKSMATLGELVTFDAYKADKDSDFETKCFLSVKEVFNRLVFSTKS